MPQPTRVTPLSQAAPFTSGMRVFADENDATFIEAFDVLLSAVFDVLTQGMDYPARFIVTEDDGEPTVFEGLVREAGDEYVTFDDGQVMVRERIIAVHVL